MARKTVGEPLELLGREGVGEGEGEEGSGEPLQRGCVHGRGIGYGEAARRPDLRCTWGPMARHPAGYFRGCRAVAITASSVRLRAWSFSMMRLT